MIVIFIIHHLMMYIIHYICVLLPGKYKPLLEMKCANVVNAPAEAR